MSLAKICDTHTVSLLFLQVSTSQEAGIQVAVAEIQIFCQQLTNNNCSAVHEAVHEANSVQFNQATEVEDMR